MRPKPLPLRLWGAIGLAGVASFTACSLNPKPLPPDEGFATPSSSSGASGDNNAADSGRYNADAQVSPPPSDAGGDGHNELAGDAADGATDGGVDAGTDAGAGADATLDAPGRD
jgi:hypothetical protein